MGSLTIAFFIYLLQRYKSTSSTLPKLNAESMIFTVGKFMDGLVPDFLLENAKKMGKVFRLNMPDLSYFIVIGDADLARKIYDEEDEKPHIYKNFEAVTAHRSNIFTKHTHGENWEMNRKGVASGYSVLNIAKSLPLLRKKCDELTSILQQFSINDKSFDIAQLMVSFTFDFIGIAMFGTDFRCLSSEETTEGKEMLKEISIAMKEYALKV